ncbi:MAG: putative toxin-antitoxin system toxin component, PIN family [Gammaproteobacteria bacterium]|nr:putative toxin-antitoxin system toxin component, PIN family [Gammaproteobacteria bacterium]
MDPLRLVLDTNVLLSALLFRTGSLAWLREAWQSGTIRPLASRDTTAELIKVLSYPKFHLTDTEIEELLGDYLPWCEIITVSHPVDIPECRDPLDRPFLVLAQSAKADALVTGDKDLLILVETFPVPILSPASLAKKSGKLLNN